MSLDITLIGNELSETEPMVPVREGGTIEYLTVEEWKEKHPGAEPFVMDAGETRAVFTLNITHNLGKMAKMVGLYDPMWDPSCEKAGELVPLLWEGISNLREKEEEARMLSPANGWGTYELLLEGAVLYIKACIDNPQANIHIWR